MKYLICQEIKSYYSSKYFGVFVLTFEDYKIIKILDLLRGNNPISTTATTDKPILKSQINKKKTIEKVWPNKVLQK